MRRRRKCPHTEAWNQWPGKGVGGQDFIHFPSSCLIYDLPQWTIEVSPRGGRLPLGGSTLERGSICQLNRVTATLFTINTWGTWSVFVNQSSLLIVMEWRLWMWHVCYFLPARSRSITRQSDPFVVVVVVVVVLRRTDLARISMAVRVHDMTDHISNWYYDS